MYQKIIVVHIHQKNIEFLTKVRIQTSNSRSDENSNPGESASLARSIHLNPDGMVQYLKEKGGLLKVLQKPNKIMTGRETVLNGNAHQEHDGKTIAEEKAGMAEMT
jgi:hypothetical protein